MTAEGVVALVLFALLAFSFLALYMVHEELNDLTETVTRHDRWHDRERSADFARLNEAMEVLGVEWIPYERKNGHWAKKEEKECTDTTNMPT